VADHDWNALAVVHRDLTIALARGTGYPVYYDAYFAVAGGLSPMAQYCRRVPTRCRHVDRILKGEKPADLRSSSDEQ